MKAPQAIGWWIKDRSVDDPTSVLAERDFGKDGDEATRVFLAERERAEASGGSAVLMCDGRFVMSYSLWGKND